MIDFISESEISPGEATDVRLSFVSIIHVAAFLRVGGSYHLCEGTRPIGEVQITRDVWRDIHSLVSEGYVRHAVVDRIGWTQARLLMDGGIVAHLSSEDVGLRPWDEIGQTLHCGDAVTVRVERIDRETRSIKNSFIERAERRHLTNGLKRIFVAARFARWPCPLSLRIRRNNGLAN